MRWSLMMHSNLLAEAAAESGGGGVELNRIDRQSCLSVLNLGNFSEVYLK